MKCRGHETREQIVRDYVVEPVAHIQLLNGQTKHSDAGALLENDYYIFKVTDRDNGENKDTIQCGMDAAKDFLDMLEHDGLPLFNPLRGDGNGGNGGNGDNGGGNGGPAEAWDPLAKQLYNAIMWIIILIDAAPNTVIYDLKEEVEEFRARSPYGKKIRAVNTIIRECFNKETLTSVINKQRLQNVLRDDLCQFNLIQDAFENMTDRNGNRIVVESFF